MKIVHVINAFYPCQLWGGPPKNTYLLSKAFIDMGHQVEILTTNILDYKTRISRKSYRGEWEGIPVTYLKAYWWGRRHNSVGYIVTPDILIHRSLVQKADIVHLHGYRHFLFNTVALLAMAGHVPYVFQARGSMVKNFGRSKLKNVYDETLGKFIARHSASAIALSDEEATRYLDLNVKSNRIFKLKNPVDLTIDMSNVDPASFRNKWKIASDEKVVLFLSRLHEKKGLDLLINAIAGINSLNIRLVVVGPDDGFLNIARAMVNDLGLNKKVFFTGPLYGNEKFGAYQASDVYVLPTRGGEGFPTTILEACFSRVPIIVTNRTEAAEFVADRFGIVVDYDVDSLANAVLKILSDSELAATFKENAKNMQMKEYDPLSIAKRLEEIYNLCRKNQ